MYILWGVIIFTVGVVAGIAFNMLLRNASSYAGVMKITRTDEKIVYSLELQEDPAMLEYVGEVVFKVETSDESSNRE